MKKFLSLFLVILIVLETFVPFIEAQALTRQLERLEEDLKYSKTEQFKSVGNLEIDLKFDLPIANIKNPNMGVKVRDSKGNVTTVDFNGITTMDTLTYKLGNQTGSLSIRKMDAKGNVLNGEDEESRIVYYAITLYDLEKDTYEVTAYGDGYKTFTIPNVTLNDYSKRVRFSNFSGMFTAGDMNQDGIVNQADIDLFMNQIENEYSIFRDFNRDGNVDITDLSYLSYVVSSKQEKAIIEDTSAILDHTNFSMEGNVSGEIEDLITDNGLNVTIKPKNEVEISKNNAAEIDLSFKETKIMSQIRLSVGSENTPEEMVFVVTDENGKTYTLPVSYTKINDVHGFTDKATDGTVVVDLKGQIAVKKVTIQITKTSSNKLAEIAKVEFLNKVYEEVPTPKIEVPRNLKATIESEAFTLTWNSMANITGYEILVQEMKGENVVKNSIYQTGYNTYKVDDLDNYTTYKVSVRAVNAEWKGTYSNPIDVTPIPNRLPPKVDMVVLTPIYNGIVVSYKDMKDTLKYNIYYREKGTETFTKVADVTGTNYTIENLKTNTEYEVCVSGINELGEGAKSEISVARTKTLLATITPNYYLINRSNGTGNTTDHIQSVETYIGNNTGNEFATVDDNYATYWNKDDWDSGAFYGQNAPSITLDNFYTMNQVIVAVPNGYRPNISWARINYWDESGNKVLVNANVTRKSDKNGNVYYVLKTEKPFKTNKVQAMVATYASARSIQIAEIKFYNYDSLEDDVKNLFQDDLRVELKPNVTLEMIEALEKRANTKDSASDEFHPNKEVILSDLDYAKKILADKNIQDVIVVDQNISNAKNSKLGMAMSLNDFQPLGVVARKGETLVLYVGTTGNVLPQLVFTQFYAEANVWKQVVVNLQKGQNIIEVPQIGNMNTERGGSVYLRYPNATKSNSEIKVRVSGGSKIPVLDTHGLTDENEIRTRIEFYINELSNYVGSLKNIYESEGQTFDSASSVLNSTEIVTDNGLFSIAATAAYNGIKSNLSSLDEQVNRVNNTIIAFESMMNLFYRQKGLSKDATDEVNRTPGSRINIRYMRMFDGAFMYAGGEHIGIGYGSIAGLLQGRPNKMENGKISTTGFFGWGISHEIGHQINQGKLVMPEVTNNVYSLLAQTNDDQSLSRIEPMYEKIFEKVTSGTLGNSSNVFLTLGMYWQLHLAYDNELTYSDENSIYARINTLSRTLDLKGSKNDLLLMYASNAAGRNLTTFFQKWGLTFGEEAINYARNYPEEERPIWYLNDSARRNRLANVPAFNENDSVSSKFTLEDSQNKKFSLSFEATNSSAIYGYEISRNGTVIAFVTEDNYTDYVGALNNQALTYEVVAYDHYLNRTKPYIMSEVKVSYDGSIAKNEFGIESNFSHEDESIDYENPDFDISNTTIKNLIDQNNETFFHGTKRISTKDKSNAYVILHLNDVNSIAGFKYQAKVQDGSLLKDSISNYRIYVSADNANWTLAKEGKFDLNSENNYTQTVYFDKEGTTGGNQLWTYDDISYVKIESVGNTSGISGAEMDVLTPPGDNIDASKDSIGILKNDYHYLDGEGKDAIIPAGSVVFSGNYRGNPAFNVALLVDAENENPYEGTNFLFAKLNDDASLDEIASGTWFYVLTKEQYEKVVGKEIRFLLYRVNDAITNEGERLTSSSYKIKDLPDYENLPELEIIDTTKGEVK